MSDLDTTHPYGYFDDEENLIALIDYSDPDETLLRTHGAWKPMTEPQIDLLDGMEMAMMDSTIIPVIDQADEQAKDFTRAELEQYILPQEQGNG